MKTLSQIKGWKELINEVVMGDCLEGMKLIPDKSIDLVLTDPPYGIEYNSNKMGLSTISRDLILNDNDKIELGFLFQRPETLIMFGANNYYKQLPHKGTWLCWDKRVVESADKILGSHFELAWCSKPTGYFKMYRIQHAAARNADGNLPRQHPTQKPIELMRQIILDYTKEGDLVCDPFMGSGTVARACKDLNRRWIGFEIEEKYCKVWEERMRQENLF